MGQQLASGARILYTETQNKILQTSSRNIQTSKPKSTQEKEKDKSVFLLERETTCFSFYSSKENTRIWIRTRRRDSAQSVLRKGLQTLNTKRIGVEEEQKTLCRRYRTGLKKKNTKQERCWLKIEENVYVVILKTRVWNFLLCRINTTTTTTKATNRKTKIFGCFVAARIKRRDWFDSKVTKAWKTKDVWTRLRDFKYNTQRKI